MANEEDELVLLQYSCSGNVKWKTLRLLTPIDFSEPQYVTRSNESIVFIGSSMYLASKSHLSRPQYAIHPNESSV